MYPQPQGEGEWSVQCLNSQEDKLESCLSPGSLESLQKQEAKQEEASPRLGVSWTHDGLGKGVGSELNPAMAALVIASQQNDGPDRDFADASPRLSGQAYTDLPE